MSTSPESEQPVEDVEPAAQTNALRGLLVNGFKVLVTLAIVVAIVFAVKSQWSEVKNTITELNWWTLAASSVFIFLGMGAAVRAWQHALGALEQPIPAFDAARAYLVGQLGKYLPAVSGLSFCKRNWSGAQVCLGQQASSLCWSRSV